MKKFIVTGQGKTLPFTAVILSKTEKSAHSILKKEMVRNGLMSGDENVSDYIDETTTGEINLDKNQLLFFDDGDY